MTEKTLDDSIWHGRIFRYVPLILCICLILIASTTNASSSNTSRFIRPLLEYLFPDISDATLIIYHGYIRKFAHFSEYGVLAFFAARAFWNSSKHLLRKYWHLFAFIVVLIVSLIDEVNQSFDVTRTGSVYDVLIDCFGGSMMISFMFIYRSYVNKKKEQ